MIEVTKESNVNNIAKIIYDTDWIDHKGAAYEDASYEIANLYRSFAHGILYKAQFKVSLDHTAFKDDFDCEYICRIIFNTDACIDIDSSTEGYATREEKHKEVDRITGQAVMKYLNNECFCQC